MNTSRTDKNKSKCFIYSARQILKGNCFLQGLSVMRHKVLGDTRIGASHWAQWDLSGGSLLPTKHSYPVSCIIFYHKNKMMALLFLFTIRRLDPTIESQGFSNNWVFMMLLHYLNAGQEKLDLFQSKNYVMISSLEIRCIRIHSKQSLWIDRTSLPLRYLARHSKDYPTRNKMINSSQFFLTEFYMINRICRICRILI